MDRFRAPAPAVGDDWVALSEEDLPVAEAAAWVRRPHCGAVVTFTGAARDHSPGRGGVHRLDYEAYEEQAVIRMAAVLDDLRRRWPAVGRVALLHRTGSLAVSDAAVVVAVSAPHRVEAFAAAHFAIDELKRTVPIWKREAWADGESWGLDSQGFTEVRP